ncbi:hypothetical protein CFAM422_000257 [Trichoderma lentiforme]|uniref:Uncharacterized protein n=1 Tax=Trichoderma lentiforme TaxID=1567552 RepID=A0A9P4XQ57_9HYPO|nr:hypothetical protein CFAM422_000257 [Trichoderma lentiforme]
MAPLPLNSVLPCATLIGYDVCRAEIRGTDGWPANNGLSHKGAELLSTIQVGMQAFVQLAQGVPLVVLLAVETLRTRLPHYVCAEGHQSRYRSSGAVGESRSSDGRKPDGVSTYGGHHHPLIHAATPLKLAKITTQ